MNYFVTAIGTNSGKTLISSILVEALQADYYKPIQSGTEDLDYETIEEYSNNAYCIVYPSQFILKTPVSPHHAAKLDHIEIRVSDILWPDTPNTLVIEGAGGILVPINEKGEFMADLIQSIDCEVILVIDLYLGCINHSLLTINELKRRNIKVKGVIFNGDSVSETENIILQTSGYRCLLKVKRESVINQEVIKQYAIELMANFYND
jgi:dethiobiotin synthetase